MLRSRRPPGSGPHRPSATPPATSYTRPPMDLHLVGPAATREERLAVDAFLDARIGPATSGWDGGTRDVAADSRLARGGHEARAHRDLLLPVLHAIQDRIGWISQGALNHACRRLMIPPADAYGVATFYALLSTVPRPARVVHVCDDMACRVAGAEQVCDDHRTPAAAPATRQAMSSHTWTRPGAARGQQRVEGRDAIAGGIMRCHTVVERALANPGKSITVPGAGSSRSRASWPPRARRLCGSPRGCAVHRSSRDPQCERKASRGRSRSSAGGGGSTRCRSIGGRVFTRALPGASRTAGAARNSGGPWDRSMRQRTVRVHGVVRRRLRPEDSPCRCATTRSRRRPITGSSTHSTRSLLLGEVAE